MTESNETQNSPNQSHQERQLQLDRKRFFVEIITLVVLFLYVTIAAFQWCAMRKANEITRESLKLNERLIKETFAAVIVAEIGFTSDGTVNVGFENRGKVSTSNAARYEITLESLPAEKPLLPEKSFTVTDHIPREGEKPMPNHYYELDGFTKEHLASYKNTLEAIRVSGTFQYDDGFGQTVTKQFCRVSVAFSNMDCDAIGRYLRALHPPNK
ncbi:MAG: hypothetical protein WA755_05820 [Candidatus Acidiferrales bacterium]